MPIKNGRSENNVAKDVRDGFKSGLSAEYNVEVDDGEDVLIKAKDSDAQVYGRAGRLQRQERAHPHRDRVIGDDLNWARACVRQFS